MKAAVFYGPGDVRLEDVDRPSAGVGDVVIRVEAALSCGTDLKTFRRGHPLMRPPRVMGHEYSGVVVEAGEDSGFEIGDRVAGVNSGPCMSCKYCSRGRENLCESLEETLIGFTSNGAFAEYCLIPRRVARVNLLKLASNTPFEEAAFLEPLSCVIHGLNLLELNVERIAILGSGSIGLLHLQAVKQLAPNARVSIFDPHWEKLSLAEKLGADRVVNIREESFSEYERGFDLVIEAVGRVEAWETAARLADKGGTVLFFGGCPRGTTVSLDTYRVHYEELRLLGAFHHTPRDVKKALQLIESGKMRLRELIGMTINLDKIGEAFQLLQRGEAAKILIKPSG